MEYKIPNCKDPFSQQSKKLHLSPLTGKAIVNAHVITPTIPFGKITMQRLKLDKIEVWKYDLVVKRKCEIDLYPKNARVSLHIMLRKEIALPFKDGFILQKEELNLIYMRSTLHTFSLDPGTYSFIQIDYFTSLLKAMEEKHPRLRRTLLLAERKLACLLNKQSVPMTKRDKLLLYHIMNSYHTEGKSFLMDAAVNLLDRFLSAMFLQYNTATVSNAAH